MDNYVWTSRTIDYFGSIESLIPPTIAQIGEKRWAVFTGNHGGWFRIDQTVTLEMLMHRWIKWEPKKTEAQAPKIQNKEWKIKGSKGNVYNVSLRNGNYSCECMGFGFRRKCKHVEQAKKMLTNE